MTSQPGNQIIAIYVKPNISRFKGIQKIKFSQLIKYNWKIIFLEKQYTKYG